MITKYIQMMCIWASQVDSCSCFVLLDGSVGMCHVFMWQFYLLLCIAVQAASKTLMDSLNEIYESNWVGHDLLYVQSQNIEMLWQDFSHKLGDQVLIPLNTYQSQFPEMRVRTLWNLVSLWKVDVDLRCWEQNDK